MAEAEIIASSATARELAAESPGRLAAIMRQAPNMGETGEFLMHCFSPGPANPLGAFEAMAKIRKARGQAV